MTRTPPPLPAEILRRVLRLASLDGHLLLYVAGFFALVSAANRDAIGAVAGCLAAGAGALELHGTGQLRQGDNRGMDWLVRSQFLLLGTILLYAAHRMAVLDLEFVRSQLPQAKAMMKEMLPPTRESEEVIREFFSDENQVLESYKVIHQFIYTTIGFVSLLYQGGMALYYHRRRPAVAQALDEGELPEA